MKKLQLFISYNHKDDDSRQELDKWLVNLREKGLIDEWHDGNLIPGDHLMSKISEKMDEADIILLLLSQDYLASKSCRDEMNYALGVTQKKRVISIVLKDCTWQETGCKDLLALPKDGKPLAGWVSREEAWHSVYEGIKKVVDELQHSFEVKDEYLKELQQVEFVTQNKTGTILSSWS